MSDKITEKIKEFEDFIGKIQTWHAQQVAQLRQVIENEEANIRIGNAVMASESAMAGGFRAGVAIALHLLGTLPFSVSESDHDDSESDEVSDDLDQRMAAAGMVPVSQMMEQNALDVFSCHAGVTDLGRFEEWLQVRRKEFIQMQAQMTIEGLEENELFEWVVAHSAVLGEVLANFRQAIGRDPQEVVWN